MYDTFALLNIIDQATLIYQLSSLAGVSVILLLSLPLFVAVISTETALSLNTIPVNTKNVRIVRQMWFVLGSLISAALVSVLICCGIEFFLMPAFMSAVWI